MQLKLYALVSFYDEYFFPVKELRTGRVDSSVNYVGIMVLTTRRCTNAIRFFYYYYYYYAMIQQLM